jgi:hypothetical protein
MLSLPISFAREIPGNRECTQSRKYVHLNTESLKPSDSNLWGSLFRAVCALFLDVYSG